MKIVVSTFEAVWALSSQPILMIHAIPAGLLFGMYKNAYGDKFSSVAGVRAVDMVTDGLAWLFLLYFDFKVIGWHPYFFAGWMLSALLASQAQKRWRKAAGVPAEMADIERTEK